MEYSEPRPDAVSTLLEISEGVLADERSRGEHLDTKTASLAAFSGTILALDATLGQNVFGRSLGDVGEIVFPLAFLLAAVALLIAAGVAAVGVLRPQRYLGLDEEELRSFPRFPMLGATRTEIQGRMLRTVTDEVVPAERRRNDKKAGLTKISAIALGVGLVGIAAQAGTLGLHELGV